MKSSLRCRACGRGYYAKGLCENCLKRERLGLPLNRPRVTAEAPSAFVTSYQARGGWARGADGKIEEVVPARGMNFTYGELERSLLQASDEIGGGKGERDIEIF